MQMQCKCKVLVDDIECKKKYIVLLHVRKRCMKCTCKCINYVYIESKYIYMLYITYVVGVIRLVNLIINA